MTLLIDAFNVLYKFPELEDEMHRGDLGKARRGLLGRLRSLRKKWKKPIEVHLFLDGKKNPGDETTRESEEGIFLYYSHDMSADHQIKEFIKYSPNPGSLRVITSDKDVIYFAKKHKCDTQFSEDFVAWIVETLKPSKPDAGNRKPDKKLSAGEMQYWMNMFRKGSDSENRK